MITSQRGCSRSADRSGEDEIIVVSLLCTMHDGSSSSPLLHRSTVDLEDLQKEARVSILVSRGCAWDAGR